MTSLSLTPSVLSSFQLARLYNDSNAPINSLDIDSSGEWCVAGTDEESIQVYSVDSGTLKQTVYARRYGVDLVRFTHHQKAIILASKNQFDFSLRYLSLHDNRYLRYFRGHHSSVVTLCMSPVDDTFMSGSMDMTVRLWDLRVSAPQGLVRVTKKPAVAYDPQGLIFAISAGADVVKLYDKRSYDKGPFTTFTLPAAALISSQSLSSTLRFSPDGKSLLFSALNTSLHLLDAFDGTLKRTFNPSLGGSNVITSASTTAKFCCEGIFSPDAQFVLIGADDGNIYGFESESNEEADDANNEGGHNAAGNGYGGLTNNNSKSVNPLFLLSGHAAPVRALAFSPTRLCLFSACSKLGIWIPSQ